MKIIGNIIWLLFGGIFTSIGYVVSSLCLMVISHVGFGLLLCITIIGIPFGKQHFKLAGLAFTPFGKTIV